MEEKKPPGAGANLTARGAQTIAATKISLIRVFADVPRHSWEGQLRRINPNAPTLADYSNATHLSFAPHSRPQEMYVGGMITALGCIDAGITCVIDNSHNARSVGHSDAAVEALLDSGIRAVHASGAPQAGDWDHQWPQDLTRLQKTYFSSADQLVTLRMFSGPNRDNWIFARRLGLRISSEFQGPMAGDLLDSLWRGKKVWPRKPPNPCRRGPHPD